MAKTLRFLAGIHLLMCGWATAAEKAAPASALPAPGLKYAWETGYIYGCTFTLEAGADAEKQTLRGLVGYLPLDVSAKAMGVEEEVEEDEGSGTAFVISSDGILVTCAHVVRGAVDLQVQLGGKQHAAKVIAYEPEKDLAVIKIAASGLPTVGLAAAGDVALGQDVRAIGFPLTDMLGESVKITRGTIAGIVQKKDRRLFQVDAAINPGNSGGPLVDMQGRVVGVTNAILEGRDIERIGFAIPADDVVALLKKHNLPATEAQGGADLDGPELARRVTPAVALLKVRVGPGGVGTGTQRVVQFVASYAPAGPLNANSRISLPGGAKRETEKMLVDSLGCVHANRGSLQLPLLVRAVAEVGLERLPGDDRKQWSMTRTTVLMESEEVRVPGARPSELALPRALPPSRRLPPGYRSRLPGLPPSARPDSRQVRVRVIPAIEETRYAVTEEAPDGTVTISKEYELVSVQPKGEPATLEIKGQGTIVWDKKLGMPKRSEFRAEVKSLERNTPVRVPVVLNCQFERKEAKSAQNSLASPTTPGGSATSGPAIVTTPARPSSPPPLVVSGLDKFEVEPAGQSSTPAPASTPPSAGEQPAASKATPGQVRQWTDRSGAYRVEASAIAVKNGKVYLERTDGKVSAVDLDKLSEADVEHLKTLPDYRDYFAPGSAGGANQPATAAQTAADEFWRIGDLGWGVTSLAFSPDSKLLAVGKMDRAVLVYDLQRKTRTAFFDQLEGLDQITCLAFSPTGNKLLAGGYTGRIQVWDVEPGGSLKESGQLVGHSQAIRAMTVSSDGKLVLSGGDEQKTRCWELATGRELFAVDGFRRSVLATFLSKSGKQGLACDGERLALIDVAQGRTIQTLELQKSASQVAAIAPDGSSTVVQDRGTLGMWDNRSGRKQPSFPADGLQWSAKFLSSGKYVASGALKKVFVWEVATQRKIVEFDLAGVGYVKNLACSPDNRYLAVASDAARQEIQILRLPVQVSK